MKKKVKELSIKMSRMGDTRADIMSGAAARTCSLDEKDRSNLYKKQGEGFHERCNKINNVIQSRKSMVSIYRNGRNTVVVFNS